MDHSRLLAAGLLVNLAVVGIHFMVSGPIHNGYAALLSSWASSFPTLLPNSTPDDRVYFRRVYTRLFPFVGDVISRLTPVFWPLITVQKPELTLFGIYVFGQLWASETLLILEGWRVGNMGRLVSYSTIWGFTLQQLPRGIIQPLYSAMHLLTSPISRARGAPSPALISVDNAVLQTLPLALSLGYGLSSIPMCLSAPGFITYDKKQLYLFLWQLFPLWTGLSHQVGLAINRELGPPAQNNRLRPIVEGRQATLKGLQAVYSVALIVAGATHLSTIVLVLFNSPLAALLPRILVAADPGAVFRPWPVIPNFAHYGKMPQVADTAEGFLVLLQYNTLFAGLGVLVWAMWLRSRVGGVGYGMGFIWSGIWQTALLGPCGAAVAQMRMRDEVVFEGAGTRR